MKTKAIFVATLLAFSPLPSVAQDLGVGFAAAERGDYAAALKEWKPLAEQGNVYAQFNLGLMYERGQGVLEDYAEAVRWYRTAAVQGSAEAQLSLGLKYSLGKGLIQDNILAHMWFNIAAANGSEKASEVRELIAGEMTATDITEAQRLARVCMESNYQDCE